VQQCPNVYSSSQDLQIHRQRRGHLEKPNKPIEPVAPVVAGYSTNGKFSSVFVVV